MIRLAVSPCSNPDLTLETALAEYGRLGFRRIELFTSWAKSAVGTGDDLPSIRRTLAGHGFSVSSMHLPPLDAYLFDAYETLPERLPEEAPPLPWARFDEVFHTVLRRLGRLPG